MECSMYTKVDALASLAKKQQNKTATSCCSKYQFECNMITRSTVRVWSVLLLYKCLIKKIILDTILPVTLSIFALPTKAVQKESKENQPSDSVLPLFSWMSNCLELNVWVNDSMNQSLVWFKNESVFWWNHWSKFFNVSLIKTPSSDVTCRKSLDGLTLQDF